MLLFAGDLRNARKNLDTVLRALVKCPSNVHLAVAGGWRTARIRQWRPRLVWRIVCILSG